MSKSKLKLEHVVTIAIVIALVSVFVIGIGMLVGSGAKKVSDNISRSYGPAPVTAYPSAEPTVAAPGLPPPQASQYPAYPSPTPSPTETSGGIADGQTVWFPDNTLRIWSADRSTFITPAAYASGRMNLCRARLPGPGHLIGYFTRYESPSHCLRSALVWVSQPANPPYVYWLDVGLDYTGLGYWQRLNRSTGAVDGYSAIPSDLRGDSGGWYPIQNRTDTMQGFFSNAKPRMIDIQTRENPGAQTSASYPYRIDPVPGSEAGRLGLFYNQDDPGDPLSWMHIQEETPACAQAYSIDLCH